MTKVEVSLDEVLRSAWDRMIRLLFKPFKLERWLILGFCAWLLSLSNNGGGGTGGAGGMKADAMPGSHNPEHFWKGLDRVINGSDGSFFDRAADVLNISHSAMNIAVITAAMIVVFGIALALVLYWVKCRFQFIFLDNLVHDRHQVAAPWKEFRSAGNDYFLKMLLIGVIFFIINALLLIPMGAILYGWLQESAALRRLADFGSIRTDRILTLFGVFFLFNLAVSIYFSFFQQLLIPIMYRDGLSFSAGFRRMNSILAANFWRCILYIITVGIVIFGLYLGVFAAGALSCCILLIPLMIPYIGSVILLPIAVFERYLGWEFLNRIDPQPEKENPVNE